MSGPSNIKMQKTRAEEVFNAHARWPASDLERSKNRASALRPDVTNAHIKELHPRRTNALQIR
jgi:hypothetical protein